MAYRDSYNVEYSDDGKTLIKAPKELEGEYFINSGVVTIGSSAFKGCEKLTSIHLPSSFKKLENAAFTDCKALKSIYYNGDLYDWLQLDWNASASTGYSLYFKNALVSEVTIPSSVTVIKPNTFYWCSSIKKVNFHNGVTSIGANAFNKTGIDGTLILPEGLVTIGQLAFFCCTNLTSVKIPSSVNEIWYGAFSCCYELKHISVSPNNPKYKTAIGILYKVDGTLMAIAPCASDEPLRLPDSIHKIAKDTFCYSAVPKGGLILSKNITEVVEEAFLKPEGLELYVPVGSIPYFKKMGVPVDGAHEMFSADSIFLPGHSNISAIVNNPFRVLGVYANASQKEITANARKIKRFIEVGKSVEFPTDFNNILPAVVRTEESVDAALASLSNPLEKFKYASFWFVETDESDKEGLEYVKAGKIDEAKKKFEGYYSWNLYLNLFTLSLATKDFPKAVMCKSDGIYYINHPEALAFYVCGDLKIEKETAAHIIIDTLLEDLDLPECRALYKEHAEHEEDDAYLDELLSSKYTRTINDAISTAKNTGKGDPDASLKAGRLLMKATKAPLEEFAQYFGEDTPEYGVVADRLANQILQCSIDFYNDSIERFAVYDALELAEYALSIVKGQMKKDRCKQNVDILRNNAAKVPPRAIADDADSLYEFLTKHLGDIASIDNAWNILEGSSAAIVRIRSHIENPNTSSTEKQNVQNFLLDASTHIVNLALNKLIDAVNKASGSQTGIILNAWDIILNMERFPLRDEFKKNRLSPNKDTLRSILSAIKAYAAMARTKPSKAIDLRTDSELWKECHSIEDYEYYIKRFPNGTNAAQAKSLIQKIRDEEEARIWEAAQKAEDYSEYIAKYPNGRYIDDATTEQQIIEGRRDDEMFRSCKSIHDYQEYLKRYLNGRHHVEARKAMDALIEKDHEAWKACTSKADCLDYLQKHPDGLHVQDAKDVLAKSAKAAEGIKWFIAVEVLAIILLVLYIICTPENFQLWTMFLCVGSIIIGVIVAINKYGN